ncbi:MAG: TIGR02117 family protein [Sphingomonas sp.]
MTIGWSSVRRRIVDLTLLLTALVLAYFAAGFVGGSIPANAGWRPPKEGVRIYVRTNGIHTDLVVPVAAGGVDWRDLIRPGDIADPRYAAYDHLAIGWGDRRFYLETPTWRDVRPDTVIHAVLGDGETLVHVEHIPAPVPDAADRAVMLRPQEYRRLAAFIRHSFAHVPPGQRPAVFHGYGDYDAFYAAFGRYDGLMTCNAWTGAALRAAGVRVGAWTPFATTVMGWF